MFYAPQLRSPDVTRSGISWAMGVFVFRNQQQLLIFHVYLFHATVFASRNTNAVSPMYVIWACTYWGFWHQLAPRPLKKKTWCSLQSLLQGSHSLESELRQYIFLENLKLKCYASSSYLYIFGLAFAVRYWHHCLPHKLQILWGQRLCIPLFITDLYTYPSNLWEPLQGHCLVVWAG